MGDSSDRLYETIKKIQETKGYFFTTDEVLRTDIWNGLLTNKERLGYMVCPCRFPSGDRVKDKDIICPCEYREADVKEFGVCFCGFYVSKEWLDGKFSKDQYVPDRRPPEKIFF